MPHSGMTSARPTSHLACHHPRFRMTAKHGAHVAHQTDDRHESARGWLGENELRGWRPAAQTKIAIARRATDRPARAPVAASGRPKLVLETGVCGALSTRAAGTRRRWPRWWRTARRKGCLQLANYINAAASTASLYDAIFGAWKGPHERSCQAAHAWPVPRKASRLVEGAVGDYSCDGHCWHIGGSGMLCSCGWSRLLRASHRLYPFHGTGWNGLGLWPVYLPT